MLDNQCPTHPSSAVLQAPGAQQGLCVACVVLAAREATPLLELQPNTYAVLRDCVERGVLRGYVRAHKHNESPIPEAIREAIEDSTMAEICEYFRFD